MFLVVMCFSESHALAWGLLWLYRAVGVFSRSAYKTKRLIGSEGHGSEQSGECRDWPLHDNVQIT